jgi:hypothetical protein
MFRLRFLRARPWQTVNRQEVQHQHEADTGMQTHREEDLGMKVEG